MRNYDRVFHVAVSGDRVVFGSSVDDTLRCLHVETGDEIWRYTTDGPIRLAPAIAGDKVYFGSDDGHAYCLDLKDGMLVWKESPGRGGRTLLNNDRLISYWPVRTGVLVMDGKAYFGASLLPWEPAYLCAVDALTGSAKSPGCYVRQYNGVTLEGPPAAAGNLLVFPQGRVPPALYDRRTGDSLGSLKGGGGSFAVLTPSDDIVHGPASEPRQGAIGRSKSQDQAPIASYPQGRSIIAQDPIAYMITADQIIVSNWVQKKVLWTRDCKEPRELVLAGQTLFVGCDDKIQAYDASAGKLLWSREVEGRVYGLVVAAGRLICSTGLGVIYSFAPQQAALPTPTVNTAPSTGDVTTVQVDRTPKAVALIDDPGLIGRWVFQAPYVAGREARDLAAANHARIEGPVQLEWINDRQALTFDGRATTVEIAQDIGEVELPTSALSAEAWVRVDAGGAWLSFVGAFQDNGDFERGWILGVTDDKFSFAVATQQTPRLTYLTADQTLQYGRWYHVAGVYDGASLSLYVDGERVNRSAKPAGEVLYPSHAHYEIGAYHDRDENFRLRGRIHEVCVYRRALSPDDVRRRYQALAGQFPQPTRSIYDGPETAIALGPWIEFVAPGSARFHWKTVEKTPTLLEYRLQGKWQRVEKPAAVFDHEVILENLRHRRVYEYRIGVLPGEKAGRNLECDTHFNFAPRDVQVGGAGGSSPQADRVGHLAAQVVELAGVDRGLALVLGCDDPAQLVALARRSRFQILMCETDPQRVAAARARLLEAQLYGHRVAAIHVDSYDQLPTPGNWANLVWTQATQGQLPCSPEALVAELRPDGGIAVIVPKDDESVEFVYDEASRQSDIQAHCEQRENGVLRVVRGPLPGSGIWTHQYGRADNSAFGSETLSGARTTAAFKTQWVGRPGPRFKPDRNGRKPAPLVAGGRLYIQGYQRIAALEAYNGRVIWSLEIPQMGRFNMPRDCSNWAADSKYLYVVVKDHCWTIDGATGEVLQFHPVEVPEDSNQTWEWGYVARVDDALLGSSVRRGTPFTNFWGGADEGWYDAVSGVATAKVCSDQLYAKYADTGGLKWVYRNGLVLNCTITAASNTVYFVECRDRQLLQGDARRVTGGQLWQDQFLVALDLQTGSKQWEKPLDTVDGVTMIAMAHGSDTLALTVSNQNMYHVYAFDVAQGEPLWQSSFPWSRDNHGGHMARPAIVGDKLLMRPVAMELRTGKRLPHGIPEGGCGTYACAEDSVLFRADTIAMFETQSGEISRWNRIRPDCWLSVVPAAGMILAPEGGGGCSCGNWMQTSVGFYPEPGRATGE
jgi:outer membrane protein assembly factor BamB